MKSTEGKIDSRSDFFIHNPTEVITESFLYPVHLGHFYYKPGYRLHRLSFDSFLLLYILDGNMTLHYRGRDMKLSKDSFFLIDCYDEHRYEALCECECIWIHFDGPPARKMVQLANNRLGYVFSLTDPMPILQIMSRLFLSFQKNTPMPELLLAKHLNDLLTSLILYTPTEEKNAQRSLALEQTRNYIHEHIREDISIKALAKQAAMSHYYFIRIFKNETGMTPHEYIVYYRLRIARILLSETNRPIGEISSEAGFSSDSVFCAAFKKNTGLSPTAYRRENRPTH